MESITLTDAVLKASTSSGNGCAIAPESPQNNRLPMLSFRDAAIPKAGRNHYSIHKQVVPQLWNAHTATGRQVLTPTIVDLAAAAFRLLSACLRSRAFSGQPPRPLARRPNRFSLSRKTTLTTGPQRW